PIERKQAPTRLPNARALGLSWAMDRTPFNLNFVPSSDTRETTNYANLARDPATRKQHLSTLFALNGQVVKHGGARWVKGSHGVIGCWRAPGPGSARVNVVGGAFSLKQEECKRGFKAAS
ncbi:MAG: putative oxygenase MesX, partial [Burkholderiales bacterium]